MLMPEEKNRAARRERRFRFVVAPEEAEQRLDRYLAAHLAELSRTRLQALADEGRVFVDGVARKRSYRVEAGETLVVKIPPLLSEKVAPEAIPLEILYEDDDVAVVNKPAGMVVHPGAGAKTETLVNALLHHYGGGEGLSSVGGDLRPGIVHRLDRGTSGALLVARNDAAHRALAAQFRDRLVQKTYVALLHGRMESDAGRIELPVARDLRRRTRMTARRREGRQARTDWRVRLLIGSYSFLEANLHTGRTHQLRVHFSALGHPVVGDTVYGAPRQPKFDSLPLPVLGRNFLHAARLRFLHPRRGTPIEVRAPLPPELVCFLRELAREAGIDRRIVDSAVEPYL